MNPESLNSLIVGATSATILAPSLKKLTLAITQSLPFLKKNQPPTTPNPTDSPAIHQSLAQIDQLLIELKSAIHLPEPTNATAPQSKTISNYNNQLTETLDSIHNLVDEVRNLAGPSTPLEQTPTKRQAVTEAVTAVLTLSTPPRRARVFMSTGTGYFDPQGSPYTIKIRGNFGSQELTFVSGTPQSSIIFAINSFLEKTGVYATKDNVSSGLVKLLSANRGGRFFVAARRTHGNLDNILYDESRSHPANLQVDFGEQ